MVCCRKTLALSNIVELKDKIKDKLREVYGGFQTYLEYEYENRITDNLCTGTDKSKEEWLTYNQVILELKHNLKDMLKVKELQYHLTEEEEPKEACISLIEGLTTKTPELERLYHKIINF